MKISLKVCLMIVSSALIFGLLTASEVRGQFTSPLKEIFKRMDAHQSSLFSLRSKVAMEKYNAQLRESELLEGTAIYWRTSKNQVAARINWMKPIEESLSLINGQYVLYSPRLMQAIIGSLAETNINAVFNGSLAFLRMSSKEIKTNYNIIYLGQETIKGGTPTWHLKFIPKKINLYKFAELWINSDGMPVQAKIVEPNEDSTTVQLSDFQKNTEIDLAVFQFNLPRRAKIVNASGCAGFKAKNAGDALQDWSDAVFSGRVTAVSKADYTFETDRVWKGEVNNKVVVRTFSAVDNCAVKLKVGERYVVFAQKVNVEDSNALGLLPGNFIDNINSDNGKKILKEIGKGKPVKKITVIKKRRKGK